MEAAHTDPLFIQSSPGFARDTFIIRASDMVLWIVYILGGLIHLGGTR